MELKIVNGVVIRVSDEYSTKRFDLKRHFRAKKRRFHLSRWEANGI